MIRKDGIIGVLALIVAIAGYALIFPHFTETRRQIRLEESKGLTLPPVAVKLLALEYRTLLSDYFFVRATQFFGGKIQRSAEATQEDWDWLYRNLELVTELDPYFEDPYYFGNALLVWFAHRFDDANSLLRKGTAARSWDWMPPFFLGFNNFYFLNNNKEGADYLLIASTRRDAPIFLPTLAARLYQKERRTDTAITFLQGFLAIEKNEAVKKSYMVRLDALRKILFLEKAVAGYKRKTGRFPKTLEVLIQAGMIGEIPKDPYGGVFFIAKDGSIQTTSKLAFVTMQQKQK